MLVCGLLSLFIRRKKILKKNVSHARSETKWFCNWYRHVTLIDDVWNPTYFWLQDQISRKMIYFRKQSPTFYPISSKITCKLIERSFCTMFAITYFYNWLTFRRLNLGLYFNMAGSNLKGFKKSTISYFHIYLVESYWFGTHFDFYVKSNQVYSFQNKLQICIWKTVLMWQNHSRIVWKSVWSFPFQFSI